MRRGELYSFDWDFENLLKQLAAGAKGVLF